MERKIRILYIIDHLIGFAGTEKHLLQLVSFLDKDRFSCDIIAFNNRPIKEENIRLYRNFLRLMEKFEDQGVKVKLLPLHKTFSMYTPRHFARLVALIRRVKPDIAQTFHFFADTYGVLACRFGGVKSIVSSHRDMGDFKTKKFILVNRIFNLFIRKHITVCGAVARRLRETEKIPESKTCVIYNGLDFQDYLAVTDLGPCTREKLGIPREAFLIGMVCIFRPEKGIDVFLRGVLRLKQKSINMKVLLVGDGEMRSELTVFCEKYGILSNVIFAGYVRDIKKYVAAMDAVCLTPTKNEGFSNVILEAMAMGKAVIATDVGGNSEQVLDGITGRIIPPGDPKKLADAILDLYHNPKLMRSMGLKARERVEMQFTLDRMIKNTENLYASLIPE